MDRPQDLMPLGERQQNLTIAGMFSPPKKCHSCNWSTVLMLNEFWFLNLISVHKGKQKRHTRHWPVWPKAEAEKKCSAYHRMLLVWRERTRVRNWKELGSMGHLLSATSVCSYSAGSHQRGSGLWTWTTSFLMEDPHAGITPRSNCSGGIYMLNFPPLWKRWQHFCKVLKPATTSFKMGEK